MFAAALFALFAVSSAQQYARSGVNPILNQHQVPALSHNAAFVQQDQLVPQVYGVQGYGQRQAYGVVQQRPQVYAGKQVADADVQRDYGIESFGQRYAINSGPASFNYHFTLGEAQPAVHHQQQGVHAFAQPQHFARQAVHNFEQPIQAFQHVAQPGITQYGIPHHQRHDVFNQRVGSYNAKDLIASK